MANYRSKYRLKKIEFGDGHEEFRIEEGVVDRYPDMIWTLVGTFDDEDAARAGLMKLRSTEVISETIIIDSI